MPWIKQEVCSGCGCCIDECPAGAISIVDEKAYIDMQDCIRCAICHDICPENAIRHDSETVSSEIKANINKTKKSMIACASHFGDTKEAQNCLKRWIRHYHREKTIAEKTMKELQLLEKTS
jgi:Fe-S-cluster-containing hydrogenase component 2